jgi:hypothetical protein
LKDLLIPLCCCGVTFAVFVLPVVAGLWKMFEKAGRPGWESLVPIYNGYVLTVEICKLDMLMFILQFVPVANIYSALMVSLELAKRFGKEQGFGIGIFLLPMIFVPLLGFSKDAVYDNSPGAGGGGGSGRPRRRDEYDDE